MGFSKRIRKKIKSAGRKVMGVAGGITRIPFKSGSKYSMWGSGREQSDPNYWARSGAAAQRVVKPMKRQGGAAQIKYQGETWE
jgi:hypothetical protein